MKIIRPTTIADAQLGSSSVPETDLPEWSAAAVYPVGAQVQRAATHRRYESAIASNHAIDPATDEDGKWTDIGPTNRWAMFDGAVGTQTTATGTITVTLAPGGIDALAILDTTAETVTVTMTVGTNLVYSEMQSANVGGSAIDDWYSYFFEPIGQRDTILFLDLPVYSNCSVAVTITGPNPTGLVAVGTLIVGRQLSMGSTERGVQIGINDYSKKTTDDFGVTSVVERPFSKTMTGRFKCDTSGVDALMRAVALVRAKPVIWIAEDGFDSLVVYGFYSNFSVELTYAAPGVSYGSFTIQGLI